MASLVKSAEVNSLTEQLLDHMDEHLAGEAAFDAFGRTRVSEAFIIGDFKQVHPEHNSLIFIDEVAGNGAIAHQANEALTELTTGGTDSGDRATRQTIKHFRYQSGKSTLVELTGILGDAARENVRGRIGLFYVDNGLYFELSETLKVVIRTKTSGSVVNTPVEQADWNIDKLDGNGPSGITLDTSKNQIFVIDFQWLGGGGVRFGVSIGGRPVYCHRVEHSNILETVYMSSPTLPVRYEVENTGVAAAATILKQICFSVSSEGGSQPQGILRHAGTGIVTRSIATDLAVIMSIRLNLAASRSNIVDIVSEVFNDGAKNFHWALMLNPTITAGAAASWTDVGADSFVEVDVARTGTIGAGDEGIILDGGYGTGRGSSVGSVLPIDSDLVIGTSNLAGTTLDEIVLAAQVLTATGNFVGDLTWRELA